MGDNGVDESSEARLVLIVFGVVILLLPVWISASRSFNRKAV